MSTLQNVYDQWQNNLEFRSEFKKNPTAALIKAGLELTPTDFEKIKAMLNKKQDSDSEELDGRISK